MRQPRGIQRVLQTIWPKQNKHYASQLPVEREMARPAEKREGALSFWGAWPAEGQWGGRSSSNAGESRTLFSDGKNGSSKKKTSAAAAANKWVTNICSSDSDAEICVEIHAQLHLSCLEDCFCQSASPSAEGRAPDPLSAPYHPLFSTHHRPFSLWSCRYVIRMYVCLWSHHLRS